MRSQLRFAATIASLVAGFAYQSSEPQRDQVKFVKVGQGDATIIRSGGRTVLIDDGPVSDTLDAGERYVVPALRNGSARLDVILLTHPDLDHVGGTAAVLRAYPGTPILISEQFRKHRGLIDLLARWHVRPGQVHWINDTSWIAMGRTQLRITAPPGEPEKDNSGSLLVRAKFGACYAVFTGDAPEETEVWASHRFEWTADLMKVGHHGSASSTSNAWLAVVKPKIAVVSCGRNNRYGHPAAPTLARLSAASVKIRRTDQEGDICYVPTEIGWVEGR